MASNDREGAGLDTRPDRHHGHVVRWIVVLVVLAGLTSCSFVRGLVGTSSASACIRKECRDPDAQDYSRCEAACRQRYRK
jgi:hypothetical protein